MIRYITLCVAFVCMSMGYAQYKIVEKSGKKPKWVGGIVQDYLIGVATSEKLEDAKQQSLIVVKEQIVKSVADHISTTTTYTQSENSMNEQVQSFLESFTNTAVTQSGKVDFLKGISFNKVEEYYWEKEYNKKTKESRYNYYIKYPFSAMEQQELVIEYNRQDKALTDELERCIRELGSFSSVEQASENIRSLQSLSKSFRDQRADRVANTMQRYQEALRSMAIIEQAHTLGKLTVKVEYKDRPLTISKPPRATSKCADIRTVQKSGDSWEITYTHEDCYEDEVNTIRVQWLFPGVNLRRAFNFDVAEEKSSISIDGNMMLEKKGGGIACTLPIYTEYSTPITIKSVTLTIDGILMKGEVYNASLSQKGNHQLSVNFPNKEIPSSQGAKTAKGVILFENKTTGETQTYRFFNRTYVTNW